MIRIGLTGGIASGKSTVARFFHELSIPVIDADIAAREVVKPGEPAYHQIVDYFGHDVLQNDLTIDRKKLGAIIFNNDHKREALNAIVHPEVRKWMLERVKDCQERGERAVVLDIPLLIESQLTNWVDKVLIVYVPFEIQKDRLMKRNLLSEEEALARIGAQMPLEEKKAFADAVIDNSGSIEKTKDQCLAILKKWHVISDQK
ncbi:dephospho-CoA kinase [Camelliibacillus cellulosilyticus]|uniref:Dephospho-CoA kinase n=1 Tax=Camelliibacillus cellulosilyticus TaxID=2174486 RepID=A0ABV9GLS2_9BACL